jgi:hypothetical protein
MLFFNSIDTTSLPIRLVSFDAKLIGKTINFKWATNAEINSDYPAF